MLPSARGQSTEFLEAVLSQRGPSALPYKENIKWVIRQHLLYLTQVFPSLIVQTSNFTHYNGRTVHLLQTQGTIPMVYQAIRYNIPATIWLLESYPYDPPLVYVIPLRDMVIKKGHPFVDPFGMVSSPYLRGWTFPSSTLLDMVRNLGMLFGQDPPLYSIQSPVNHSGGASVSHAHMPSTSGGPINPRGNPSPPFPKRPNEYQFMKQAIDKLVESFHNDIAEFRKTRERDRDFSIQAKMKQRGEQYQESTLTFSNVVETWLQKIKRKQFNFDMGDALEPCDVLSKQLLLSLAADVAIEEILYSLDKAVQEEAIPVGVYLKNVRALSREQFFHRAMSFKVQLQAYNSIVAAKLGAHVP